MRNRVIWGDCRDVLPLLGRRFDMAFLDPPDNLGLDYDGVPDKLPREQYLALLAESLECCLAVAPVVWISFNAIWLLDVSAIVKRFSDRNDKLEWKSCVQVFTFGQHRDTDFGNSHRPLWRLQLKGAPFRAAQVRVESWRQANGDKRACPDGKVPMDVFDFPRVVGNAKQRRPWHPTQLHEGLVERCILSATLPGQSVLDPFAGSGTTLRVCRATGRECVTIDASALYCEMIAAENEARVESFADLLDGGLVETAAGDALLADLLA